MRIEKLLQIIAGAFSIALSSESVARDLVSNERYENVRFEIYKREDGKFELQGYGSREDIARSGVAYCQRFFPYYSKVTVSNEPLGQYKIFISRPYKVSCGVKPVDALPTPTEARVLQTRKISKSPEQVIQAIKAWAEHRGFKGSFPNIGHLLKAEGLVMSGGRQLASVVTSTPHDVYVYMKPPFSEFAVISLRFSLSVPSPKQDENNLYLFDRAISRGVGPETILRIRITAESNEYVSEKSTQIFNAQFYQALFSRISESLLVESIELEPSELN